MQNFWDKHLKLINERISSYFSDKTYRLVESMQYSMEAGGKRLRPILTFASAFALGKNTVEFVDAAVALEFVHTYSLIHDDLPAMDDAKFRRGRPSNHKKFGEGIAVLAGDSLLTEAFYVLARLNFSPAGIRNAIELLAFEAGFRGMCGGQLLDIEILNKPVDRATLEKISSLKTAALIRASVLLPAVLFDGIDENLKKSLSSFGYNTGMAFQMVDDLLDVTGNREATGKDAGLDSEQGKYTFPRVLGIDGTKDLIKKHYEIAIESLKPFKERGDYLAGVASNIIERDR